MPETTADQYEIYVDGAFRENVVSYGVVILKDGDFHTALSGIAETNIAHRQVGGEIIAVVEALRWCEAHKIEAVTIYYDYEGLEAWATGRYTAQERLTKAYAKFVRQANVAITWQKVQSHTGVPWNEKADMLAAQAIDFLRESALSLMISPSDAPSDLSQEVEEVARAFTSHLEAQGIQAEFKGLLNGGMFARIAVQGGFFDLYNTPKKRLSPYIHKLPPETDDQLKKAWQDFLRSRA